MQRELKTSQRKNQFSARFSALLCFSAGFLLFDGRCARAASGLWAVSLRQPPKRQDKEAKNIIFLAHNDRIQAKGKKTAQRAAINFIVVVGAPSSVDRPPIATWVSGSTQQRKEIRQHKKETQKMGNQVALITKSSSIQVGERTNPNRSDWITEHAVATGLSVVEVERLWLRFQQLGCTSEGVISNDVLRKKAMYSEDTFLRKFIGYLRDDYRAEGKVTFQNFCNAMCWIDKATTRDKLVAIFNYLNNGNPLDKATVRQILPKIIENDSEQGYDRLADTLMQQMAPAGATAESYISQDTFVQYCLDRIPKTKLETLLAFNVIPKYVSEQARMEMERAGGVRQPAAAPEQPPPEPAVEAADAVYAVPTDSQLAVVAQRACKRDYRLLGNKLGFYESDMNQIDSLYRGDRFQQVYHMLIEWRKREGKGAYVITLQKVLQECLMPDIAAELNPRHRDQQRTWNL